MSLTLLAISGSRCTRTARCLQVSSGQHSSMRGKFRNQSNLLERMHLLGADFALQVLHFLDGLGISHE